MPRLSFSRGRKMYDIVIVGAGPAGLTAAIYARRANKTVLLLDKGAFGGQIATLGVVSEDPAANYVQLPMESTVWTEGFTAEDYTALVGSMLSGELTVSSDITAEPQVGYTVNFHANIK